jgi:hypothetical protein
MDLKVNILNSYRFGELLVVSQFPQTEIPKVIAGKYFKDPKGSLLARLEIAIQDFSDMPFAVLVYKNGILYFSLGFRIGLSLTRGGVDTVIACADGKVISGSGFVRANDRISVFCGEHILGFLSFERVTLRSRILKFLDFLIGKLPARRVYLHSEVGKLGARRRAYTTIAFGVLLLVFLGVSVSIGLRQSRINKIRSSYEPKLNEAKYDLEEAKTLVSFDSSRARDLILSAKEKVLGIQTQGLKDSDLDKLKSDISENIEKIAGIYEVRPSVFLDLTLISSDFKVDDVSFSAGRMLILYGLGHKVVSVNISNKLTETFAIPQILTGDMLIAAYSGQNFVFSSAGVWEVDESSNKVLDLSDFPSLVRAYAGNIYTLIKSTSTILRYQSLGGQFAAPQSWLGEGMKPDFSNVISWAIDGSLWILDKPDHISKFSNGSTDYFNVADLEKPFKASDFYTDEENSYLYILDPESSRILVIGKDGKFKAEYVSEAIKDAKRIVASEPEKKIILVMDSKLYSIDMKHLN